MPDGTLVPQLVGGEMYTYLGLKVGTIVHMRVEDVDRAKIDNVNATLVVLDRTEHGNYVVGNKAGIYKE